MRRYYLLLFIALLSISCNYSSKQNNQIDYDQLQSLKYTVEFEISESKQFLPGQLKDLYVNSTGDILVSDRANTSISQFDANGKYKATVAEKGGGPGELSKYFTMQLLQNDTALVNHRSGQRDYFAKGADNQYQFIRSTMPKNSSSRSVDVIGQKADSSYYAIAENGITNVQKILKNNDDYKQTVLLTTDLDNNILKDSLLFFKKGNYFATSSGKNAFGFYSIPYRYNDHFVAMEDSFLVARPDSNALLVYDKKLDIQHRIPLTVKQREITEENLDFAVNHADQKVQSKIKSHVSDYKPPYLDVWTTQKYIWLKTDRTEEGKQIVVLDFNGKPVGKFMLPEVDSIEQIKGNNLYTIHRSKTEGNTIRKYNIAF